MNKPDGDIILPMINFISFDIKVYYELMKSTPRDVPH